MDRQAIATMKGKTVEDLIAEFARSNKDKDLAWTTGNHGKPRETTGTHGNPRGMGLGSSWSDLVMMYLFNDFLDRQSLELGKSKL